MSAFCEFCEKVVEPEIEEVKDYEEYQGGMWHTGVIDEIEVCPDCHSEIKRPYVQIKLETEVEIPF